MTLKLTPQKAAELLKELQYAKVQMGGQLSIRDEYFKQALEKQPRWIPCSDSMPEMGEEVLCYPQSQVLYLTAKAKGTFTCFTDGCDIEVYVHDVSHWMPLPEAPL